MYNLLGPQIMAVELEPKFQALAPVSAPPSKRFCLQLRLQPSSIAWGTAPQSCSQRSSSRVRGIKMMRWNVQSPGQHFKPPGETAKTRCAFQLSFFRDQQTAHD